MILGPALGGISSGEDATFRINRPVGLKPVRESRNGGSLARVSARARVATGSMRNAGSDEKEDWLDTESVSAPEDGGTSSLERAV